MDFSSLSSLSENRRSWSAEVPLKNPNSKQYMKMKYMKATERNLPASAMFVALISRENLTAAQLKPTGKFEGPVTPVLQ